MLDLLDTYAPPLACASRYGWQRLCADVLAPYWVAGADRRDVRRAFQRRAADPRLDFGASRQPAASRILCRYFARATQPHSGARLPPMWTSGEEAR